MIQIDKLVPGGQALGTAADGKKIFFWNALPGEMVADYVITKNKSRYAEAIATSIDNPSPHRVAPRDDCYLSTSPWQIMDYDYELAQKQTIVQEIFREHHINIPPSPIATDGRDYHYRNKMEYALYWDNDTSRISLAFHARGSHRKVPITQSSIEHPAIFAAATEIVADLNSRHEQARHYQSLLLRSNQRSEISGGLYENGAPHPTFPNLTDTILGHKYSYSPNGFFQINLPVYEMALTAIKSHITTDEVLDLYAGVGTIGLSVAREHKLTLVEVDKAAFGELCKNVSRINDNHERVTVLEGDPQRTCEMGEDRNRQAPFVRGGILAELASAEDVLDYITPAQTVILDPPRAGCAPALINRLLEVKPPKIIYLSCNPATQARDVATLLSTYHITTVQTFNFFPRTPHIENLIVLSL